MVKLAQRGPIQFVEAEEFSQSPSILHGFCTRIGGVSDGECFPEAIRLFCEDRLEIVGRTVRIR